MFRRSNTSAYITASDLWSTGERSIFAVDGSLIDPDMWLWRRTLLAQSTRSTEPQSNGDFMDKGDHR